MSSYIGWQCSMECKNVQDDVIIVLGLHGPPPTWRHVLTNVMREREMSFAIHVNDIPCMTDTLHEHEHWQVVVRIRPTRGKESHTSVCVGGVNLLMWAIFFKISQKWLVMLPKSWTWENENKGGKRCIHAMPCHADDHDGMAAQWGHAPIHWQHRRLRPAWLRCLAGASERRSRGEECLPPLPDWLLTGFAEPRFQAYRQGTA